LIRTGVRKPAELRSRACRYGCDVKHPEICSVLRKMSVRPDILSIQPTKGRLMNDINSCYCTNYSICTICVMGYYRDPSFDYMETRMADAEMGDL